MKKMVRALILVIVCVMMTAPGAEIQAKTKKISLVLNGRKQRTVTISNSDKKSEMKIKVSKKLIVMENGTGHMEVILDQRMSLLLEISVAMDL